MTNGYLVCDKCKGYYQLQEGESPADFESCQCGGRLKYTTVNPGVASKEEHPYYYSSDDEAHQKLKDVLNGLDNQSYGNSLLEKIKEEETPLNKEDEAPLKILDYTGEWKQFNNGKISFKYPEHWTIKTILDDEKFEGHNIDDTIKLTIHQKSNMEDISFEELMDIWDDIFHDQNIEMINKEADKQGKTENFRITGRKKEENQSVLVAGFKFFDFLYYLHFIISSNITEKNQAEIELITQTFHIYQYKHTIESFYK